MFVGSITVELGGEFVSVGDHRSSPPGPWLGPSSVSMAAAASQYVACMHTTAAQAEQTANQAKAAAVAYETAFAETVPPQAIAANRSLLMTLVATNIFGHNTPAIATTEAQYAEMCDNQQRSTSTTSITETSRNIQRTSSTRRST